MSDDTAVGAHNWLATLRLYLVLTLALHVIWETLQLPLYTIGTSSTLWQKAFAVAHCTAGDVIIAALSLLAALLLVGTDTWPHQDARRVFALAILFGVAYTIYSEWMNTTIRASWSYGPLMPVVPWIGTGLSPLVQWIVVPALALSVVLRRYT